MTTNELFLKCLDTDKANTEINKFLVNPISFDVGRQWLKNIHKVFSHVSSRHGDERTSENSEIIKNYEKYGLPEPANKKLRIFVVGCGARSYGYLQALYEDYANGEAPYILVGVADPVTTARQRIIEMVQGCGNNDKIYEYGKWQEVDDRINGNTVDVVMIGTMDRDHAGPAVEFMNRKCHVIVEKPLDVFPEKMLAMVEAMKCNNVIAVVCTVLEYTSHAMRMKQLIKKMQVPLTSLLIREQVGWHHDAYAYGVGPFSNSKTASPYTVAKTIHDASMAINLMEMGVESLIYLPSKTPRSTGNELAHFDPVSYMAGYTHKILRSLLAMFPDEHEKLKEAVLSDDFNWDSPEEVANLYRFFHNYLYDYTNYWYNPQLRSHETADQPNGFDMVMNMENGAQFTLMCQPYSTKVCVRYYEARSPAGELTSSTPEIKGYLFGQGGEDVAFAAEECEVPNEENISHRTMHEGADAKFIHTVMRQIAQTEDGEDFTQHPLSVHFERNAKLTAAMLDATAHPYELRTV